MHAVRDWGIMVLQPQEEWNHDENSILAAANNSGSARRLERRGHFRAWAMLNQIENDRGERRGNISQLLLHGG